MMPKLLLADDSITVQRVIALTFQGEGIEVIAVGDGDQAVEAIDRERPQIVLADLSMPGRDGYAVAEYVKRSPELARDIRVVLLTGAAEPVEEARSRALGIDGVLSKPFEPHVATALVRRLLGEAPKVPGVPTGALEGDGASATAAADATPGALAGATQGTNAIAVDDYFRRLDEALATAGLSTAPESAGDLAGVAGGAAADRSKDAETVMIQRPSLVTSAAADAETSADDSPKLVDAFSALLAAEEGADATVVAGPIEMVGAPAPMPAVEWTTGQSGASVEAVAETVAFQAVAADAAETAAAEAQDVGVGGAKAAAVVDALPDAPETLTPTDSTPAEPLQATASPPPVALRADVPDQAALDGIDLDVFADAVAQKILHRLTDARIDAIVSERVLEIAERLVREEIDRIKADAQ